MSQMYHQGKNDTFKKVANQQIKILSKQSKTADLLMRQLKCMFKKSGLKHNHQFGMSPNHRNKNESESPKLVSIDKTISFKKEIGIIMLQLVDKSWTEQGYLDDAGYKIFSSSKAINAF